MSTATPAADAVTGRELGGPMLGNVTQLSPPLTGACSAGGRPICSSLGSGGAVLPSTTTSMTSGAAFSTAPSIASWTVTADDGQPLQLPSSSSLATPSSVTPRYCTPPACDPR